jgi:AraC family transcriptional regulator, transcriptional activator of pobA
VTPPSPSPSRPDRRRLAIDRLATEGAVEVRLLDGFAVGEGPIREPHRHDYHELMWLREGEGVQLIDGEAYKIVPGTVTVIARGQVHQFRHARGLRGGLLRITDAALGGSESRLLGRRGAPVIPVPAGECDRYESVLRALHAETRRPPDPYAADLVRHLTATLLSWLARWDDASRVERPQVDDADVALHGRFAERLERDFARHHDVAHYADALGVPAAALSRALVAVTGRATKELIVERVMTEAMRLLRFTDLTVGEVAYRVGYDDPLYFSRAFKRYAGRAPQAYRSEVHGSAPLSHTDDGAPARH